jgi:hypothetical protein
VVNYPGLFDLNNILYIPIQLIFFSRILSVLIKNITLKKFILITVVLFLIATILLLFIYPFDKIDSILQSTEQLLLISYCILYYYERLQQTDTLFIYTTSSFWAINAIFIYASGTFFVYLFRDSLSFPDSEGGFVQQYRYVHYIVSIIKNLLIALSFTLTEKPLKNNATSYF